MNRSRGIENYFGGRRRAYWAQQGGFEPPYSLDTLSITASPNRSWRREGISRSGLGIIEAVVPLGIAALIFTGGILLASKLKI